LTWGKTGTFGVWGCIVIKTLRKAEQGHFSVHHSMAWLCQWSCSLGCIHTGYRFKLEYQDGYPPKNSYQDWYPPKKVPDFFWNCLLTGSHLELLGGVPVKTRPNVLELSPQAYIPKIWSGLVDQRKVDRLTVQNVIFDILEPHAFQKYSKCWVLIFVILVWYQTLSSLWQYFIWGVWHDLWTIYMSLEVI